jgi:hypothetical protein
MMRGTFANVRIKNQMVAGIGLLGMDNVHLLVQGGSFQDRVTELR